jgi:AGZA family xanthine/uracil permease-like MFS transporter
MNPQSKPNRTLVARFFKFAENGTTTRTEILAGVTTFFTMVYILAVNPSILGATIFENNPRIYLQNSRSLPWSWGIFRQLSLCLGTGNGIKRLFAFSVVPQMGIDWRVALLAIFLEGLLFIFLTLTPTCAVTF